jgi:hypothetical protein
MYCVAVRIGHNSGYRLSFGLISGAPPVGGASRSQVSSIRYARADDMLNSVPAGPSSVAGTDFDTSPAMPNIRDRVSHRRTLVFGRAGGLCGVG